jgi:hypothetical protein
MHIPFLSALYWRRGHRANTRAQPDDEPSPPPTLLTTGDVSPGEKKQYIASAQPEQSTAAASIAKKMPMHF